jgi:hypothetical protein
MKFRKIKNLLFSHLLTVYLVGSLIAVTGMMLETTLNCDHKNCNKRIAR